MPDTYFFEDGKPKFFLRIDHQNYITLIRNHQSLKLTEEQQNLAYGQKNENIQTFLFKVFAADNAKDLFLKIHATHRKFYMKVLNECDEALNFNKGYLSTHFLSVSEEDWQICLNHNKVQAILLACLKKQIKYELNELQRTTKTEAANTKLTI